VLSIDEAELEFAVEADDFDDQGRVNNTAATKETAGKSIFERPKSCVSIRSSDDDAPKHKDKNALFKERKHPADRKQPNYYESYANSMFGKPSLSVA